VPVSASTCNSKAVNTKGCDISTQFEFSVDCNDDWFGTAFIDDCGVCSSGNSGHFENSDIDCNDECFGTAFIDSCNDCVQGYTGLEENYADQGCGCDIPAPMTYCEDSDGDNFGNPGTETDYCIVDIPDGWVMNCSDPEPDCSTNNTDYCGECGGGGQSDLGCGCFLPASVQFYFDSDGDSLGAGEPSDFCLGEQPNGWVQNNDDVYPDCNYNFYDECGICGGDGSDNLGCGCFEPAPLEYCYDSDGDSFGTPGSETEYCLDDIPLDWVIDCSDPYPECDGEVDYCDVCNGDGIDDLGCGCFELAAIEYCYDADGDGLGSGFSVAYCVNDVPDNWVADCSDTEPFCATNDTDGCEVCGGDNSTCTGCIDDNAWNFCDVCTIDDESCIFIPEGFSFSQSTAQAFYFVIEADVLEVSLNQYEDWIGVFKGDICVGSRPWEGTFTSVPAMGDDGSEWAEGYLVNGDYPTFKIFDASENTFYETEAMNVYIQEQYTSREYNGWENFGFFEIERLRALVPDCDNIVDGNAYEDECGECVGGTTGLQDGWALDCADECFGDASLDNCAICSGGQSGHVANSDNIGCGCFEPSPLTYWYDADGDGLGSGEPIELCLDNISEVWVQNEDDLEPFCPTNDTDECGICAGNNENMDCAGNCYGPTLIDECGVCGGDGNSCMAPIAVSQTIETDEDSSIEITLSGYDVNGNSIYFTIVTLPSNGILTGEIPNVTYIPNLNFNGEDSFEFMVSTSLYDSEPASVTMNILPVNDFPVVYDVQSTLIENESASINLQGFDIDGDELSFNIVTPSINGSVEIIDGIAIYIPIENYFGIDSFTYTAYDGEYTSNISIVLITILGVNSLPEIDPIDNLSTLEDIPIQIQIIATDIENDMLIYGASIDDNADYHFDGTVLTIEPFDNYNGEINIDVIVGDGYGFSIDSFILMVVPVNDPPEIMSIPSQIINEDEELSINLNVNDIDEDDLFYTAFTTGNAVISVDNNSLIISPEENYFGEISISAIVNDGEFSDTTSFTVLVLPVNDPPVLEEISDQSSNEDEIFIINLNAEDPDNTALVFFAYSDGNSIVSIEGDELTLIPNLNFNGDIIKLLLSTEIIAFPVVKAV